MNRTPLSLREMLTEPLVVAASRAAEDGACHAVGGALRDRYLEIPSLDLDLVVAGEADPYSRRLAEILHARLVDLGGRRFSSFRLIVDGLVVDIWGRGRSPLEADLERRDLRINAFALDLKTGEISDPFRGLVDLERRMLTAVSERSFSEDPLRTLRLARFAVQLPGFDIEERTLELARAASARLGEVASERRREELSKLLLSDTPSMAISKLLELDVFPRLWRPGQAIDTNPSRLCGTLRRYEEFERLAARLGLGSPNRIVVLHTLLARELEDNCPPPSAASSLPTDLVTRTQRRDISRLLANDPSTAGESPRAFLAHWKALWIEAAAVAYASASSESRPTFRSWIREARDLFASAGESVLNPKPLLDGRELKEMFGIPPGPLLGRILALLLEAQLAGKIETRQQATELLPTLIAQARR